MAELYGRDLTFLLSRRPVLFSRHLPRFNFDRTSRLALIRLEQYAVNTADLERLTRTRVALPPTYKPTSPQDLRTFEGRLNFARLVAEAERRRLDLGRRAIPNLLGLLERAGAHPYRLALGARARLSAAMVFNSGLGAFILVNSSLPPARQAFAAAHEYGHLLIDRYEGVRTDSPGELRQPTRKDSRMVMIANAFAGYFLGSSGGSLPQSSSPALPASFVHLVRKALRRGAIDPSRAAELLRRPER